MTIALTGKMSGTADKHTADSLKVRGSPGRF